MEHTEQVMGQPIQQVMEQPIQQDMGQPIQQVMEQPIQQVMGQPIQQVMGQPIQQVMGQPIQQVMGQPIQQVMEQPIQQVIGLQSFLLSEEPVYVDLMVSSTLGQFKLNLFSENRNPVSPSWYMYMQTSHTTLGIYVYIFSVGTFGVQN